jgi:DNA repair protein RecN (Recombination protein N)
MKRGKFELAMKTGQDPTATGIDEVEMRFSANPGRKPQPLIEVASGGELSRLMLAIKRLSAKETQAVVFDEIDSGVSGEVAHAMGKIMKEMSEQRQILSITHLPQIASKGGAHYKVYKEEKGGEVLTRIERLSDEERIEEIAQMLSGSEMTKAAMDNARDLLHSN